VHYQVPNMNADGWAHDYLQVIPFFSNYADQVSDYRLSTGDGADSSWGLEVFFGSGEMPMGSTGTFHVKDVTTGEISRAVTLT